MGTFVMVLFFEKLIFKVGDDKVNVRVFDITYAKYNGPYPTGHIILIL